MFINHLSVMERGDGVRATHTFTQYLLACTHTHASRLSVLHTQPFDCDVTDLA